MRYCKECGKPLKKNASPIRKYCSTKCYYKHYNRTYNENRNKKKKTEKYKRSDYEIKNYCVACGKEIPGTWKHFLVNGNYCAECGTKAEKNWRKHIKEIKKLEAILI